MSITGRGAVPEEMVILRAAHSEMFVTSDAFV